VVRDLRPQLSGRRIMQVSLTQRRILRYPGPVAFRRRLAGRRIESVGRRGKYLVLPLDDGHRLVIHLGMTGHLRVCPRTVPLARHTHLRLALDRGQELRFDDQRQFGRVMVGSEEELSARGAFPRLGPEPLSGELTADRFAARLRSRHRPVKSALLDQSFVAGLGNIYADEACFLAGVRPTRRADRLTLKEGRRLYGAIEEVLTASIAARGSTIINYADGFGLPGGHQGRLVVYGRGGQACLRCGSVLDSLRLAGRTAVYCRRCQR